MTYSITGFKVLMDKVEIDSVYDRINNAVQFQIF